MESVRIGVIGLGWFGEVHCDAIQATPGLELAGLCTRTESRLKDLGRKYGVGVLETDYRALLGRSDLDAVSIVTMWDQHTEPTLAALAAGKHVFLEKPMASTVEDCARIVAAAEAAPGFLMVGHICRFNPRYAAAKREIEAGNIGRIVALSSRRNIPAAWTPEILNKIGPIIGDAIHDTDLMLWFTGAKVVSAYAQTVDVRGLKYPDIGQTMYRFDSGATATLETVWCMPEKTPFDIDERMSIIGTEGFIHIQDTFPNIGICTKDGFRSPDTTYWPELHGALSGALREEFLYFARCVRENTPPTIITPEESMEAVRTTLAAERSAAVRAWHVAQVGDAYDRTGKLLKRCLMGLLDRAKAVERTRSREHLAPHDRWPMPLSRPACAEVVLRPGPMERHAAGVLFRHIASTAVRGAPCRFPGPAFEGRRRGFCVMALGGTRSRVCSSRTPPSRRAVRFPAS